MSKITIAIVVVNCIWAAYHMFHFFLNGVLHNGVSAILWITLTIFVVVASK